VRQKKRQTEGCQCERRPKGGAGAEMQHGLAGERGGDDRGQEDEIEPFSSISPSRRRRIEDRIAEAERLDRGRGRELVARQGQ
jgi:hypothetical protein